MPDQKERLQSLLATQPILRAKDMRAHGIDGSTIQRALEQGMLNRIARGLYQDAKAEIDDNVTLAEVAKRIPKGIIALTSALAYHGLTDQLPRKTWVAIGISDWCPKTPYPPIQIVRFSDTYHAQGCEDHLIAGVKVPIYSVTKTLADMFRNGRLIDRSIAIEGLRAALDQRRATAGDIADAARSGGAWRIMRPYLEALTFNG